jgi:hypothetical protein
MNQIRSIVKLVAGQALAVFVVFNIVVWTICLGFTVYNVVVATAGDSLRFLKTSDRKSRLPNYSAIPWARTHFAEFASLKGDYLSYIGWRRPLFKGETINIVGQFHQRATVGTTDATKPSIYFFGGSTMWGTGADDANTIPSLVSQIGGFRAENFGESAWVAHQSLTLLIQLLQDGRRPDVVVFYDGVNEVSHKCRSETGPRAHAREASIRAALASTRAENVYGLQYMAEPLVGVARVVSERIAVWTGSRGARTGGQFACHTDADRARRVADALIQDWEMARKLTEAHGGRFIGILQPVAHFSATRKDHIRLADIQRKQFEAVYPLIRARMAGRPGLHDLTGVLDRDEHIYIDFCHVSPNGNRYVAQRIVELLESRGAD